MNVLIVLFITILLNACQTIPIGMSSGSVSSFEALALFERGEAVVIDVRSEAEKKLGGPQGIVEIQFGPNEFLSRPASAEEREDFARKVRAADVGSKTVFLLCQYGVRSGEAQRALAEQGIASISIAGGWLGRGHLVGLRDWLK